MIGKVINGKYNIDELIGVGGMAKVYKAHDITTGEPVAIKFLKEENQQNAEYVRRFEREAQAGMSLKHQNIVKLLDTGVADGANYIVFEYVNGPTLKDYILKHGKFSLKSAVNIIGHILDAIGYAHEHGIIHRDVKPQNVIITSNGTVKLADFGIARLMNASTKSFTGIGAIGSVHYISPEQAEGKETTCQTDIYSAGIILYEMLTGKVPFDNENEVSVAVMHIKDEPIAPMMLNPEISHALNAVILKATAKNMQDRYKSALELKTDLLRALREPDGTFADMIPTQVKEKEEVHDDKKIPKMIGKLNRGVFIAGVTLVACIVLMIGAFLIVRATYKPTVTVQSFIKKTVDEAQEIAGKSVKLNIQREPSEQQPGYIIRQDPPAGARIQKGSTVNVYVSIGTEHVVSPDLMGLSVSDANALLQNNGLCIGEVKYAETTEAENGKVFKQEPKADEEIKLNTKFTLYISGKPQSTAQMPNLVDTNIKKAVEKLNDAGFTKIIVRCVADSGTKEGNIISQGLDAGLNIDTEVFVYLTVSATHGKATYDGAFNIALEEETPVLITVDTGEGYEIVVYEAVKKGSIIASFTAYMDKEGSYDCIVYKSEVEDRRNTANFTISD